MIYENFEEIPFQNRAKQRLKHIYAVLYYMKKGYDHTKAIKEALKSFNNVDYYQTIADACYRRLAGNVRTFLEWYSSGKILAKLVETHELNRNDRKIFAELLEGGVGEIEEASVNSKSQDNTPDLSELNEMNWQIDTSDDSSESYNKSQFDESDLSELSKIITEIDVVEEAFEEDDSYGQADLIKKSFEEWAKDAEKEDIGEANKSEVSSKTHTVQERKDVESDYKKVPDEKPVKIESWRERQRKREAEIEQTFNWFVEKAKKER